MDRSSLPLMIGDICPDFEAHTSQGPLSFHKWLNNSWCILFSHPKDFTPVCTTELGQLGKFEKEFATRNVKIITISLDSLANHNEWIKDIEETQNTKINYPLIADENHEIALNYGMIRKDATMNATARTVFIIDPAKKIRLIITYPQSTGRNFQEILRVIDSMQLTDSNSVATPADWKWGDECVILPSVTDPQILKQKFPQGWEEVKPYLRMTPQPKE